MNSRLVQCLGVDFDHVAVGVEDIDLRESGGGVGLKPHLQRIELRGILAVSFRAQELDRLAVAPDADREMTVARIDAALAAEGGAVVDDEMELLRGAGGEPRAGEVEGRPFDGLEAQNFACRTQSIARGRGPSG